MSPDHATVQVGDELPPLTVSLVRADLVRYAGASGDFNVIHWNERVAREVGLPNVIAHGMLTMAQALRVVTGWTGDPGSVVEYGVRFTRPVVVPDDDQGGTVEVTGKVTGKSDDGEDTVGTVDTVTVTLTATHAGATVLGKAVATVRLRP